MKIYQLISQGCALVLLTALPSFAETKNKVVLVPGENLFPIKCETIQGSIDANDKVAPRGSLNDFESRYDSYSVKTDPGNIVFFELTITNTNPPNFNPKLETILFDKNTVSPERLSMSGAGREAWYFSLKNLRNSNRNLYISSATYGQYNLRIAYARPSRNISESQIEKAVEDSSILGQFKLFLSMGQPLNDDEKIHPVDMNALCKN